MTREGSVSPKSPYLTGPAESCCCFSVCIQDGRLNSLADIRELKQLRRRPQRRLQKNNRFNDQNNSSARASRFLVHFFDVHCTTTTWNANSFFFYLRFHCCRRRPRIRSLIWWNYKNKMDWFVRQFPRFFLNFHLDIWFQARNDARNVSRTFEKRSPSKKKKD